MKNLISLLIVLFFSLSAYAQNHAETTPKDTLVPEQKQAVPEDQPWHARRFKFSAGVFFPSNNTEAEYGQFEDLIDFEKDLGFDKNTTSFTGSFEWRISRRSRLSGDFFYLKRTSTKTLQRDIEFGDNTYTVNARISAFADNQIIRLIYGYAFISKPKYEIGALIGTHVLLGDMGIKLEGENQELERRENFDFTAPLPDIGLWGEFVLGKKIGLYVNANYFALKVDNIDGRILSYNLSVLYNVYKNFSLTAGYSGLNIRVDVERERLNGYLKWNYNGPALTATYSFGKHVKLYKH
jgi:hypothetical protein